MSFDREMMAALEADGEMLRSLTGEDHGPYFLPATAADLRELEIELLLRLAEADNDDEGESQ